jgi:hypothetical protein
MSLHDSLRELVTVRGAAVVEEAEEFRGALDDFLAEDEATIGEINLLVDAVRLGAVRRVLDVLDHGAAPEAAVREAGAGLARDRGTDDPARSCWALATLCFALGKVDEDLVRAFRADAGTVPAPNPPSAPHGRAPEPVESPPVVDDRGPTHTLDEAPGSSRPTSATPPDLGPHSTSPKPATPQSAPETEAVLQSAPGVDPNVAGNQFRGPVPPVIPEPRERASRAGTYLLVVLVALILGGLVAAGFILLRSGDDDDPPASDGPTSDGGNGDPTKTGGGDPPLISADEMIVPYKDGDISRIYAVNAIDGGFRTVLTGGPKDVLPTLSPDRRTMTYLAGPAPLELYRFDLETAGFELFFKDAGPCDHALRPGWSLDGRQVALVCTGNDKDADGIYLAEADGDLDPEPIVEDSLVRGSPTWVSETEFIYGQQDDASESAPLTFWRFNITDGVRVQLDLGLEGLQLTHADYSPEADKVLFLVSERDGFEIGDVWTIDPDGSNPTKIAEGNFAHPVWSPGGDSIGVTIFSTLPTTTSDGVEELGYIPLDDPENPVIVADPPPGIVGIPVWGTR